VFLVEDKEQLKAVMVHTGITDGAFTEIVGGEISEGDRVVVSVDQVGSRSNLSPPPGFGRRR
jgi:hypothetical protein